MTVGFHEIADALKHHANQDRLVFDQCERLAADLGGIAIAATDERRAHRGFDARPGLEFELDGLRRRAEATGEAHRLVLALAPVERPLRLALAAIAAFKRLSRRLTGRRHTGE